MLVKEFNIIVDLDTKCPNILDNPRAFFLTHTHTDHLNGFYGPIVSSYLQKYRNVKIYMTELSYLFIKYTRSHHDDQWIFENIELLNMGTNIVTLPADPEKGFEELILTVKVLPASHSLGSVMFLFKTQTLRVLFTGDFRLTEADVEKYTDFQDRNLDALYVDTTFLNGSDFYPKRSEVVDSMIEKIKKWLDGGADRRVGIKTSATTGYEDVFNQVYFKLGIKVYVNREDLKQFYMAISNKVPGVTNSPDSPIHLCAYRSSDHHSACLETSNENLDFLTIRLSAMRWNLSDVDSEYYEHDKKELRICYATHCSSAELKYFINYFNCPRVYGHPNNYVGEKESPGRSDNLENELKRRYFSPKKKCETTIVPAKKVKNLLTCFYGDQD